LVKNFDTEVSVTLSAANVNVSINCTSVEI